MTDPDFKKILDAFGLPDSFQFEQIGTGHINNTFRLIPEGGNGKGFILQRINTKVFTQPEIIASNLELAAEHLRLHHPDYFFKPPLLTKENKSMWYDHTGHPWRLYNYIEESYTIDKATAVEEAHAAAAGFGKFGKVLNGADVQLFKPTIERFHDLALRYEQFETAFSNASPERISMCEKEIQAARKHSFLVDKYVSLIGERILTPGVFHNDTKINNILFGNGTRNALAVIDLDTVMPGYFIYDLGDLIRTLVSPVSEEEKDISKIAFRKSFYDAVMEGYLSQMDICLRAEEMAQASFSGPMMTYIMALRFLADFLRGDTYYHVMYEGQNLVRASNQLRLLELILSDVNIN